MAQTVFADEYPPAPDITQPQQQNNFANFAPSNSSMPPEWIARVAIHELRISQILNRHGIIMSVLQNEPFLAFQAIYAEKIEFLELALTQRHLVAESDITNLVDSTISLQEFIMLESIRNAISFDEHNEFYNRNLQEIIMVSSLWQVGIQAFSVALKIAIIIALIWSRTT
jgi:hypothetical protein